MRLPPTKLIGQEEPQDLLFEDPEQAITVCQLDRAARTWNTLDKPEIEASRESPPALGIPSPAFGDRSFPSFRSAYP